MYVCMHLFIYVFILGLKHVIKYNKTLIDNKI